MIQVTVNGDKREFDAGISVLQLLKVLNIAPERVVVELNKKILKRDEREGRLLEDGDSVEVVHFVGGGT